MIEKEMGFVLEGGKFILILALLVASMVFWDGIVFRLLSFVALVGVGLASAFYDIEVAGIARRKKKKDR